MRVTARDETYSLYTINRVSQNSECIYHLLGDRWYGKMKMDSGKRWFCSVAEAEAAGCRAPKS
jgi:hypothetical protein